MEEFAVRKNVFSMDWLMQRVNAGAEFMHTPCWVWNRYVNRDGYGRVSMGKQTMHSAHRIAWENIIGPIPRGLVIDHLCRNRACCNPAHMELVTAEENTKRGDLSGNGARQLAKTHCPRGHEYTEDNTYMSKHANGSQHRTCKTCQRTYFNRNATQRMREWRARKKAESK